MAPNRAEENRITPDTSTLAAAQTGYLANRAEENRITPDTDSRTEAAWIEMTNRAEENRITPDTEDDGADQTALRHESSRREPDHAGHWSTRWCTALPC